VSYFDFLRYSASAILLDAGAALQERVLLKRFPEIVIFRLLQFLGHTRATMKPVRCRVC